MNKSDSTRRGYGKKRKLEDLVNNKSKPSKKELNKIKTAELGEGMEEDEVELKKTISSTLGKAEFNSSFKVRILLDREENKWYLQCSCKFGKRYGGPCIDE